MENVEPKVEPKSEESVIEILQKTLVDSGIQIKQRRQSLFGNEVVVPSVNNLESAAPKSQYEQILEKELLEWTRLLQTDTDTYLKGIVDTSSNKIPCELNPEQQAYVKEGMDLIVGYLSGIEETVKTCNFLLEKRNRIIEQKSEIVKNLNALCDLEVADLLPKY